MSALCVHARTRRGGTGSRLRAAAIRLLTAAAVAAALWAAAVPAALAEQHGVDRRLVISTFESEGMGEFFDRVLTEAYARLGYVAEVRKYPAERALFMADQGLTDGEAARVSVIEKDYPNLIRVPTPVYVSRVAVLTKLPHFNPEWGWEQLANYRLTIRNGYKFLEDRTLGLDCHHVSSYGQLIALVLNDRVEIGLAEYFDILPTLATVPLKDVRILDQPMARNPMYHYLHKRHADLVPEIDRALREMNAEGRMADIRHKMVHSLYANTLSPCPMLYEEP